MHYSVASFCIPWFYCHALAHKGDAACQLALVGAGWPPGLAELGLFTGHLWAEVLLADGLREGEGVVRVVDRVPVSWTGGQGGSGGGGGLGWVTKGSGARVIRRVLSALIAICMGLKGLEIPVGSKNIVW